MVAYYPGVHYEILAAAGLGELTIEYLWSAERGPNEITTTFSNRSLGDPDPKRRIVIVAFGDADDPAYGLDPPVSYRAMYNNPDTGYVKVGDKYAIPHVNGETTYGEDDHVSIHSVLMPTGTTADFVLSGGDSNDRKAIAVYRVTGEHSMIYQYDWGDNSSTSSTYYSMTLDLPEKGVALFGVNSRYDDRTFTPNENIMQIDASNLSMGGEPYNAWAAGSTENYGSLDAPNNNYDAGGSLSSSDRSAYCSISFAPMSGARPPVNSKYILSSNSSVSSNSYTFSNIFIGNEQDDRYVVVATHAEGGIRGDEQPTVKLNSVTMNAAGFGGTSNLGAGLFWLKYGSTPWPDGDTATITVSWDGVSTASNMWISVWTMTNHESTVPILVYSANNAVQEKTGPTASMELNHITGGAGFTVATFRAPTTTTMDVGSGTPRVAARNNTMPITETYYDYDSEYGYLNQSQASGLSFQLAENGTGVTWTWESGREDTYIAFSTTGVVFY